MDQKYSLIISPNFEDEQGFWPKISQESAYTNFKLKKEKKKNLHREKEKRKPLSFMMCYIMILVRYQKKILLSKSEWGRREERARERDEPQGSTALNHVPATAKGF